MTMDPFVAHVIKELVHVHPEVRLALLDRHRIADSALLLLKESEALIPGLTYSAYSAASGHKVEIRARVKGPKVKAFTVWAKWSNGAGRNVMQASCIITNVVHARWDSSPLKPSGKDSQSKEGREDVSKRKAVDLVRAELEIRHGQRIQWILDALQPDRASQLKAQSQMQANQTRSHNNAKKFAMERLEDTMRSFEFSKKDVIEAWELAQVKRVMES